MSKSDLWGPDEEDEYQERAAILEWEAGMSRAEAEHTARRMVARRSGKVPPRQAQHNALQHELFRATRENR